MLYGLHPVFQGRAPFQHDGPIALPGQQQRSKQACRAEAADHRPVNQRQGAVLHRKVCFAPGGDAGRSPCISGLLPFFFQGDGHRIHQFRLAVAGIHRQLCDAEVAHLAVWDAGDTERSFIGLLLSGGEGQADITNQDHILSYFLSCTAPYSCPAQKSYRWKVHTGGRRCSAGQWPQRSRLRRSQ